MTRGAHESARVVDVRFEHSRAALGIGQARPRVSWRVTGAAAGWAPVAYELSATNPVTGAAESTGRIESPDSVLVPWPFAPLASRERRNVRVRVWGRAGGPRSAPASTNDPTPWSDPAAVETGLLDASDWSALPIAPLADSGSGGPAALVRREFLLGAPVRSARLHLTAQGMVVLTINGSRISEERFAPGWTSYAHRLRVRTHDVTALVREGPNAVQATLADGWFRGRLGWEGGIRNVYGNRTTLLAQLEVELVDGSTVVIGTDGTWHSARSAIVSTGIYDGEHRDERLVLAGSERPGFDDSVWSGVDPREIDPAVLVAADGPPVLPTRVLDPAAEEWRTPTRLRVDLGQNIVGVLRVAVTGPSGATVTLRHAEVLECDELGVRPLRDAAATDSLTLAGGGAVWQPEFTFHGFRYAELTLSTPDITIDRVEGVVLHSDMERTGDFTCSDPEITRLFENVVWGMRGNFVDVPTDCPQRDERLGWTGDLTVFAPAATGIYDCAGVLISWLADLAAEQFDDPDGIPPLVVPNILADRMANAVWGDATVAVPWALYERYGDLAVLERAWPSMSAWVDAVRRRVGDRLVWDAEFQLGDWLDPSAPPDNAAAGRTDGGLVATAWFAHSSRLVARTADLLGRTDDARDYEELSRRVRVAFADEYCAPSGRLSSDSQTAYALAIVFDLYPDARSRQRGADRLAELVHLQRYRIGTGFAGTPVIADALTLGGHAGLAHRMLAERECPSFLYPVTMGATTVWERWDSMLPDGSINPGAMTSFNHYALGAVSDWMQRTVAGLAPAAPGYRRLRIAPVPGGTLEWATARIRTPYGPASSTWRRTGNAFVLETDVPPGATAEVLLPDGSRHEAESGRSTYRWTSDIPWPPVDPTPAAMGALGLAIQAPPQR
ncbi:family 78 glycoside hydrolase catalytic domain [Planctomonas psychrotolerans]|uniref:family 78 glycoside hydrolase catalytic domain n=1 Tax=Planctomonas psychrotolerans TaxID=2528712 RepID=UPI00123AD1CA|nr:family 78 glycoside hydrolase catalytic domain [Planctomonas psychrotolerans]